MIDRLRNAGRVTATYSSDRKAAGLATAGWLSARGLAAPPGSRWDVAIALDVVDRPARVTFDGKLDTRFHVSISANEWGYFFCHHAQVSWIRVTDNVWVHERDEYQLARVTPPLRDLALFVGKLEATHKIAFQRRYAHVATNLVDSAAAIKRWIVDEL